MARWIWLPSERTLANTVVLFRREFDRSEVAETGWISADSRYRLWVNGQRVQWGPAPCDPRHTEKDPVDLRPYLRDGRNAIAVEVLYFGHGDGTWPFGTPGLIADFGLTTDRSWRCVPDPSRPRGTAKRWYLRSLQERVDLRHVPTGWTEPGFDDSGWLLAMELPTPPDSPAISATYGDYSNDIHGGLEGTFGPRAIPLLREGTVAAELRFEDRVAWSRDPEEWFDFRVPDSFKVGKEGEGRLLTYRLPYEAVGFPCVEIEAKEGATVHLMVQESHDHSTTPFLDSHFYQWSRWTLAGGTNRLEPIDYESFLWLQLHIVGDAEVKSVAIRRRQYPWPHAPNLATDDPALEAVWSAAVNTLHNSAQDNVVDGMGRERQQYSGDGGHQLHPVRQLMGAPELSARFLRTYAHGMTMRGAFLDSWPAWDRLARLWQRNVGANAWGPILDHSIGFVFDHYHHWMQTGDLAPVADNWKALETFLLRLEDESERYGLLLARPKDECTVWIDHDAFLSQDHKRCAYNLYAAAMLREAAAPLARALGLAEAKRWESLAKRLLDDSIARYWDEKRELFVGGHELGDGATDDRALALGVLYGFHPRGKDAESVRLLADFDSPIGHSYPASLVWNHWALIRAGRMDAVLHDLRTRWRGMASIRENNTLQEHWRVRSDSTSLMSHCALSPLIVLAQGVVGLEPLLPGYTKARLRPQPVDIGRLSANIWTPLGTVEARITPEAVAIRTPEAMEVDAAGGEFEGGVWRWARS